MTSTYSRTSDTFGFDELTIRREGEDRLHIRVALREEGGELREASFEYRRTGRADGGGPSRGGPVDASPKLAQGDPPGYLEIYADDVMYFDDIGARERVDGTPLTPWKATSVYRRDGDGWRIVHAHWSVVKEA